MEQIPTVRHLIDLWPTRKVLAEDVAATKERVDKWAQTESIPAKFHARIIRSAATRGFPVTADDLVRLHDQSQDDAA